MGKLKLTGKDLRAAGYPESPVISLAMNVMGKEYKHEKKEDVMEILKAVLASPAAYLDDAVLGLIAKQLITPEKKEGDHLVLNTEGVHIDIFGKEYIEEGALIQMEQAARLPVSVAGALMPDAHAGYGLPIGGVLATENAIIPYGVGVDIGCRMALSIFAIDPKNLIQKEQYFVRELQEATMFGSGKQFEHPADHAVMDSQAFRELPLLRNLQNKAWKQLGTSGSGNHFVEFGTVEITGKDEVLNMEPGVYLGLLSHSGSRALGANIANHYTRIAKDKRKLPGEASNLAWLDMDEEEGMEYWIAMNLAGDYAAACHDVIHRKIAAQLGESPIRKVENHHNFAWKEIHQGKNLIVHRKGATPAGKDVLGIIPGSMTAPGFIVKGKGVEASINSASHGAGRKMSRTKANASITHQHLNEMLAKNGVRLLGGGLDEAPQAYKDIEQVMKGQQLLVDITGRFLPKIVRMDGTTPPRRRKASKVIEGE